MSRIPEHHPKVNLKVEAVVSTKTVVTIFRTKLRHNPQKRYLYSFEVRKLWNKKFWEELIACFPLIGHGRHRK
jgi:hypothetical protein